MRRRAGRGGPAGRASPLATATASKASRIVAFGAAVAAATFFVSALNNLSMLEAHLSASLGTTSDGGMVPVMGPTAGPGNRMVGPEQAEWSLPFVHVLTTRFMQEQPHLHDLARARLFLFEKFCLPTVVNQSVFASYTEGADDPRFLWIIKTDPALPGDLLAKLLDLVRPHRQIYVVGSNINYGIGIRPGGWRGGEAGSDVLRAHAEGRLHCGSVALLRRAHAYREKRIVLETRLDADDGLNFLYIERVQVNAARYLSLGPEHEDDEGRDQVASAQPSDRNATEGRKHGRKALWMYWCAMNHVAWDPSLRLPISPSSVAAPSSNATRTNSSSDGADPSIDPSTDLYGLFIPWKSPRGCISAGITTGASVGVPESDMPRFPHQTILDQIRGPNATASCGLPLRNRCLDMIESPKLAALRSRTPTSAGMRGVRSKLGRLEVQAERRGRDPRMQRSMWTVLENYFGVTRDVAREANEYVRVHLAEIAADNLRGQCTRGHSCKMSAREELARLVDLAVAAREEEGEKAGERAKP